MDTYKTESTPEEHSRIITDVRFMPNSTRLATSSFDRHVKLWDATQVRIYSFWTLSLGLYLCFMCPLFHLGFLLYLATTFIYDCVAYTET